MNLHYLYRKGTLKLFHYLSLLLNLDTLNALLLMFLWGSWKNNRKKRFILLDETDWQYSLSSDSSKALKWSEDFCCTLLQTLTFEGHKALISTNIPYQGFISFFYFEKKKCQQNKEFWKKYDTRIYPALVEGDSVFEQIFAANSEFH